MLVLRQFTLSFKFLITNIALEFLPAEKAKFHRLPLLVLSSYTYGDYVGAKIPLSALSRISGSIIRLTLNPTVAPGNK